MNRVYTKLKEAEINVSEMENVIATATVIAYYAIVTYGLHTLIQAAY
ncbi:hypothetical protein [Ekhidna sp.]